MMHNLRRLDDVPRNHLRNIARSKTGDRKARLIALLPDVEERYALLEGVYLIGCVGIMAEVNWAQQARADLVHCYERSTQALVDLKQLIIERQNESLRDSCPYCGIGMPSQFDHYLPKEKYPEYSVHAYNLVPCCNICNGKKSDIWLGATKKRIFLNFYIDILPSTPVLKASVQWEVKHGKRVPVVTFELECPAECDKEQFELIQSHFGRLELLSRYRDQAHAEFLALRDAAIAREASTVGELRAFINSYISRRELTLGKLNWKMALYKAIAVDVLFLQECLKP